MTKKQVKRLRNKLTPLDKRIKAKTKELKNELEEKVYRSEKAITNRALELRYLQMRRRDLTRDGSELVY